ncbi:MAG: F0F1 ATP synthase subunit A [Bacteroidota bacterium]
MPQETTTETHDVQAAGQHTTATAGTHKATADHGGDIPKEEVFSRLLGTLGDHHEFAFGPIHAPLPIILLDQGQLYTYPSEHAMEDAGKFTLHKGSVVHAGTEVVGKKATGVDWDFSITNFVVYEWIAIILIFFAIRSVVSKYKKNPLKAPSGFQNAIEATVLYVRDEVIYPNIPSRAAANRLMPYFLSLFFFIAVSNLIGLLPGAHATTGAVGVTMALAITAFFVVNFTAIKEAGIGHWFHHLLGGAPIGLAPIMVPIELIGLFTKPFALTIRLFANMTAGHVVLVSLVGLIFFFKSLGLGVVSGVAIVSVAFSVFIYALELLVAFLQAYVFTILTAVFVGLAIGEGHHHDEEHAHEEHKELDLKDMPATPVTAH